VSITISRLHRPHAQFTQISNDFLRAQMPVSAFRVACYALSHSASFALTSERIGEALGMHRTTVGKAIRDLEEGGWLITQRVTNALGHRVGTRLVISDVGFTDEEREAVCRELQHGAGANDAEANVGKTDTIRRPIQNQEDYVPATGVAVDVEASPVLDLPVAPVTAPAPKPRRKPKVPLPDSWSPSEAHAQLAEKQGVTLKEQVSLFRDHALANDRRQADWDAAFRMWLGNAAKFGGGRGSARPPAQRDQRSGVLVER
jgi:hypothetical protein